MDDNTDAWSELKQTQLLQTGKGKKRKAEEEAEPAVQEQEVATPSQEVNADDDNSDSDEDSSDDERWDMDIFININASILDFVC